jgi:hypothetical protein
MCFRILTSEIIDISKQFSTIYDLLRERIYLNDSKISRSTIKMLCIHLDLLQQEILKDKKFEMYREYKKVIFEELIQYYHLDVLENNKVISAIFKKYGIVCKVVMHYFFSTIIVREIYENMHKNNPNIHCIIKNILIQFDNTLLMLNKNKRGYELLKKIILVFFVISFVYFGIKLYQLVQCEKIKNVCWKQQRKEMKDDVCKKYTHLKNVVKKQKNYMSKVLSMCRKNVRMSKQYIGVLEEYREQHRQHLKQYANEVGKTLEEIRSCAQQLENLGEFEAENFDWYNKKLPAMNMEEFVIISKAAHDVIESLALIEETLDATQEAFNVELACC